MANSLALFGATFRTVFTGIWFDMWTVALVVTCDIRLGMFEPWVFSIVFSLLLQCTVAEVVCLVVVWGF